MDQSCSDGEPSAMSNMTTTAKKFLHKELKTESSTMPQSSAISEHSSIRGMPQAIREWLTSSLADSLANHSPKPGGNAGRTMSGICGPKPSSAFAWFDPVSRSLKMSQASLALDISTESFPTWPRAGTMRDGLVWEQMTSERTTEENDSGFWPTPRAAERGSYQRDRGQKGKERSMLTGAVKIWATPSAADAVGSHGGGQGRSLRTDIANWKKEMWPTPRAEYDSGKHKGKPDTLHSAVKMFPTPTRRDYRTGDKPKSRRAQNMKHTPMLNDVATPGGQLNPTWVEWLMGWPIEWTDLRPLEMDKFLSAWLTPFQSYLRELLNK